LLYIPAIAYAGQPFGIGAKDVVRVTWRQLVGALVGVAVGFSLRYTLLIHAPGILRTAVLAVAYLGVYFSLVVGLFRVRMPLGVVLGLLRDILPVGFAGYFKTPPFISRHMAEDV
jgi:hypothetical protein